ncbi:uncharacterized protein LOC130667389 isoform X2 [Microplitis mediator]|uniref:uncharacterized protein LOC130667389 isoform X2 n=1 Tax=Microplitis mediator TaxID=375433 RepID=UPI002552E692|nr:uncharacterized protein LOC130667389 isoform X2 [Microplitis mediator]
MPCDGKNQNCDRRRELLSQLKCLVSSMDRKKPCEWDEPPCPPPACMPDGSADPSTRCMPIKAVKSVNFRGSVMYRCECIKRNGLQDRCMMLDCMGRPECMTKLYPICYPGRAALLKLTDLGDTQTALDKFYAADKARESALAAYCRLVCPETNTDGSQCAPPLLITPPQSLQDGYQYQQQQQQFSQPHCQPCHQSPEQSYRIQKQHPCNQGPGDGLPSQHCQPCYQSPDQSCRVKSSPCYQAPGDQFPNQHCQPCYQSNNQPVQKQSPRYQSCHRAGDYYQSFYQSNQRNQPHCPYQSSQSPQYQRYQSGPSPRAPCMIPNYVHC